MLQARLLLITLKKLKLVPNLYVRYDEVVSIRMVIISFSLLSFTA